MAKQTVHVFSPATIANVGGGFDVLGIALHVPGDYVTVSKISAGEFMFSVKTSLHAFSIPPEKNIAAFVAQRMMADLQLDFGIEMTLYKKMPIGSGLGSSGASAVAAAFAVNHLLTEPLNKQALLPYVILGEEKACGTGHGDNVAPALFGGGCIIRHEQPFDIIRFPIHPDIVWIILSPQITLETSIARGVLPDTLSLKTATRQMGNIAGLVLGLSQGEATLIQRCMEDHIAEPHRKKLIPAFSDVEKAALKAGAIACHISGSGPAIFAISLSSTSADHIGLEMQTAFQKATGLSAVYYISRTNTTGVQLIEEIPHAI